MIISDVRAVRVWRLCARVSIGVGTWPDEIRCPIGMAHCDEARTVAPTACGSCDTARRDSAVQLTPRVHTTPRAHADGETQEGERGVAFFAHGLNLSPGESDVPCPVIQSRCDLGKSLARKATGGSHIPSRSSNMCGELEPSSLGLGSDSVGRVWPLGGWGKTR